MDVARCTRTDVTLQWSLALPLLVNVGLALSADLLPDDWMRPGIDIHNSIGVTALGLVLLRVLWRASHRPPPLPLTYAPWERKASHAADRPKNCSAWVGQAAGRADAGAAAM